MVRRQVMRNLARFGSVLYLCAVARSTGFVALLLRDGALIFFIAYLYRQN